MGILQARMLEWVAIAPPPGDLPNPRDQTQVSCIVSGFFTVWATRLQSHKGGSIIILWKRIVGFSPNRSFITDKWRFYPSISWILHISLPEKYFCPHVPWLPSFTREAGVGGSSYWRVSREQQGQEYLEIRDHELAVWELMLVSWWVLLYLHHFLKSWTWMPCR